MVEGQEQPEHEERFGMGIAGSGLGCLDGDEALDLGCLGRLGQRVVVVVVAGGMR